MGRLGKLERGLLGTMDSGGRTERMMRMSVTGRRQGARGRGRNRWQGRAKLARVGGESFGSWSARELA